MNQVGKFVIFIKNLFINTDSKYDKSRGLTLITALIILGFLGIIALFVFGCCKADCSLSLSLIFALASLLSGAFLGFLFGIPRSLQRTQNTGDTNGRQNISFADNTNLEQISDWLTKIIVGVSLTQLDKLGPNLHKIAVVYADGIPCMGVAALPFSYSVIIFYSISGFLYSYLWTRINLKTALNEMDDIKTVVNQSENRIMDEIQRAQLEREKIKILRDEKDYATILTVAQPALPTVYDDPQKGRWGGKAIDNDRELSVLVTPHESQMSFKVVLTVKSTSIHNSLTGQVYFFLHDSYEDSVMEVAASDNKAVLEIVSFEAFTVGVVCDEGKTKLELDINQDPNVPLTYKYK